MPIRNMWSLEPGEAIVADKLKDYGQVFFPIKDIGIDLILIKNDLDGKKKILTFQIKESREHGSGRT